jgi:hypothetical protein
MGFGTVKAQLVQHPYDRSALVTAVLFDFNRQACKVGPLPSLLAQLKR